MFTSVGPVEFAPYAVIVALKPMDDVAGDLVEIGNASAREVGDGLQRKQEPERE